MGLSRLISIFICLFGVFSQMSGVPAYPKPIVYTQPDGTQIEIRLHGDEFFNYKTTTDGFLIKQDDEGFLYYMETDSNKDLIMSSVAVNNTTKRTVTEKHFLSKLPKEEIHKSLALKAKADIQRKKSRSFQTKREKNYPLEGQPRALVILVEFRDLSFSISNPKETFNRLLNETGYSDNGATGSVLDYFTDNSSGKFRPQFDVYGPVQVSRPFKHYGGSTGYKDDNAPEEMIMEACELLNDEIDFSLYDTDNDGVVDNVYVFYAGYSEAESGVGNHIWPHSFTLTDARKYLTLQGKKIDSYACSNELKGKEEDEKTICGIGTFVHEFCHVLGLPDLYDTTYKNLLSHPKGWSVLASSMYHNSGMTPSYMSGYERYCLGWLTPIELNSPGIIELDDISTNTSYIIKTSKENEYFILENRQQHGWDKYIPGHGMIVWHIDYDDEEWHYNMVNVDGEHQRVDIKEADGMIDAENVAGDAYPGTFNVTSFTDNTEPAMRTWDNQAVNKPITHIVENDGKITFRFRGGDALTTPVTQNATEITHAGFIANWEEVEYATSYFLDVYCYNGQQKEYSPVYHNYCVGNTLSYLVNGLEAGTSYFYQVKAANSFEETENSNEMNVKTLDATFDLYKPKAIDATEISERSFKANWEETQEATSYFLNVYEKTPAEAEGKEIVDFSGKLENLPLGWTMSSQKLNYDANYFGREYPSYYLSENNSYLQSPVYDKEIKSLKFWYRVNGIPENNESIIINGHDRKNWKKIHEITELSNSEGETIILDEKLWKECYGIEIVWKKEENSSIKTAIDDIVIEYGKNYVPEYLTGFANLNVGNSHSFQVTNLDLDKTYYYTVRASNGEILSDESNEIEVKTTAGTSIAKTTESYFSAFVEDNILYVRVKNDVISKLEIYDMYGHLFVTTQFKDEIQIPTDKLPQGIYLLKVNNKSLKIKL